MDVGGLIVSPRIVQLVNVGLFASNSESGAAFVAAARAAGFEAQLLAEEPAAGCFDVIAFDGLSLDDIARRVSTLTLRSDPSTYVLAGLSPEEVTASANLDALVDDVFPNGSAEGFVLCLALAARHRARRPGVTAAERLEQANDTIYTVDFEGRFTWANAAAETLTGYSRRQLIGMHMSELVAPEFYELAREKTLAKTSGASPATIFELEIVRSDGERRHLEISSRMLFENGRPVGIQGIARDLTHVRRLETQLRQEHEDLLAAQAQMWAVFESSNEAILVIDPDLRLILANARAREHALAFFGSEPRAGEFVRPWVTEREWPEFEQYVARALAGEHCAVEWRRWALDGKAAWFESDYSPVRDARGAAIGVAIVGRDVTAQRQLLLEVEEREAALSAVFASINEGITLIDPEMRFILGNQLAIERAKLFVGREPQAGGPMSDYVREQDWENFSQFFARALSGEHVSVTGRFDHPVTGEPLWTNYDYQPVRDAGGEIVAVARVSRDVTKTRLAERALRAADRYNRALVENTADSLFVLDVTGEPGAYEFRVAMVNSAFCRLTGLDAERIQG